MGGLSLILALLLAACGQAQDGSANAPAAGKSAAHAAPKLTAPATTQSAAAADPCADPRNPAFDPDACGDPDASVVRFAGEWRVERVHVAPEGVQAFVPDDPAIVGARFRIDAARIRWVHSPSDSFTADDVCTQPSASPVSAVVEQEEGAALLAALRPLGIAASARGPVHRFGCIGGGTWGPGDAGAAALFMPVGSDRLLMIWYDGATLLAVRGGS